MLRFVAEPTPAPPPPEVETSWPLYGYTKDHTRFFPAPPTLHPPFKRMWVNNAHTLLEFPPVIGGDHIFQLGDDGVIRALNKRTGHSFWRRSLGRLSASSPAVAGKTVFASVLASAGDGGRRARVRAELRDGRDALVARPAQPERVLAAARPGQAVLRLAERHGVRAERKQRHA